MIFSSRFECPIPSVDVLTGIFTQTPHHDDSPVFIAAQDARNQLSLGAVKDLLRRIGYALREKYSIGSQAPGKDVCLIFSENHIMYAPVVFGVLAAEGVVSTCPSGSTAYEVTRQLKDCKAKTIICSNSTLTVAKEAIATLKGNLPHLLLMTPNACDLRSGNNSLLGDGHLDWKLITDPEILKTRVVYMIYSSGTTGIPKGMYSRSFITDFVGVQLTHCNVVAHFENFEYHFKKLRKTILGQDLPFATPGILPTSHAAGLNINTSFPIRSGYAVHVVGKYDLKTLLHLIRERQPALLFAVPTVLSALGGDQVARQDLAPLRYIMSGGSAIGQSILDAVNAKIAHDAVVTQNWGLSEATCVAAMFPCDLRPPTGSAGMLQPNISAIVRDVTTKYLCKYGEVGEILLKGPQIMTEHIGYLNNPQVTRTTFSDGWFCTGDVAYFDTDDCIHIVGRIKELIKYKSNQVSPTELEQLLITHPLVADAAIIGVDAKHPEDGQVPRAYIIKRQDDTTKSATLIDELQSWISERVSNPKRLRGGIRFVDSLPRNALGKIQRHVLEAFDKGARL